METGAGAGIGAADDACRAMVPHLLALADLGVKEALGRDPHLLAGLNVAGGRITCAPVAEARNLDHAPAADALAAL